MITADKLTLLTNMPAAMLEMGLPKSRRKTAKFQGSRFLGISNAGLFVYEVLTFTDREDVAVEKVFVKYDPALDQVTVDF
jgi:hypothetical protein